jgi:hypothetical protein
MATHGIVDSLYIRELAKKRTVDWKAKCSTTCTTVENVLAIAACPSKTQRSVTNTDVQRLLVLA